jgi:2,3-bisphosphoglycerate-independent phosphoglycerate mutase
LAAKHGLKDVFIHALIGRRGEKPESGAVYIAKVEDMCCLFKVGEIATVIGRFWALDREEKWDRIEKTYRAFVYGEGTKVEK